MHGDLGAENVLWEWTDGLPHLAGVLDWDDVTLSDPAEDFAAIGAGYGPELCRSGWSPWADGRATGSPSASPRSAAHSPSSKPSTPFVTATKTNWRTAWPTTV